MRRLSVLLVDPSVTIRRMFTDALRDEPRVRHVATAATADIALAKIPQASPDVVVVDLDTDGEDPFDTVRRIGARYPGLPVVIDSERTSDEDAVSLRALGAGATRCLSRPGGLGVDGMRTRVRVSLLPVLAEVAGVELASEVSPVPSRRTPVQEPAVLALGASTGGPDALETVLAGLPPDFPLPVLVVQHMPAGFTAQFAQRLAAKSAFEVLEARDGDRLRPGRVLLAPGGLHMRVHGTPAAALVRLDAGTPENFCRPSVDVLFRSVAHTFGGAALAVVLTGMGADGLRGAGDLAHVGAEVLTQDRGTSTVWGMPGAISDAGLASEVLALPDIVAAILRRLGREQPGEVRR